MENEERASVGEQILPPDRPYGRPHMGDSRDQPEQQGRALGTAILRG